MENNLTKGDTNSDNLKTQFNESQTNTPLSMNDPIKDKDTLTTHTSEHNSIESEEHDTRYIHINVDIHHKKNG